MRKLIAIVLLTGCASGPQLYVKDSEVVTKVKVQECSKVGYKNIDNNEIITRESCKDYRLSPKQWNKLNNAKTEDITNE